ncbi:MAG: SIMPL domain-containing protein [Planctomycetota bacterium]
MSLTRLPSLRGISAVTALLLTTSAVPALGDEFSDTPKIIVTGQGAIEYVPDQVLIQFATVAREPTPTKASATTRDDAAEIIQFLKQNEVGEKDIHSEATTLEPIFRDASSSKQMAFAQKAYSQNSNDLFDDPFSNNKSRQVQLSKEESLKLQKPVGYQSTRMITVKLREPSKFEMIYEGILERGVTNVSRVERTHSEIKKFQEQANQAAMRQARKKAQQMASELQVNVGRVLKISDPRNLSSSRIISTTSMVFGGPPQAFSLGTLKAFSDVEVTFEIAQ